MERKFALAIVILALAAFSPAPINKAKGPRTFHPEQSQAEVSKQQAFNGVLPVVGQVPQVVNEVGIALPPTGSVGSDSVSEKSVTFGSSHADKISGNITEATIRLQSETSPSKMGWIWGLIIGALGFGAWKLFQYKVEKSTPVPQFSKRFLKEFEKGNF